MTLLQAFSLPPWSLHALKLIGNKRGHAAGDGNDLAFLRAVMFWALQRRRILICFVLKRHALELEGCSEAVCKRRGVSLSCLTPALVASCLGFTSKMVMGVLLFTFKDHKIFVLNFLLTIGNRCVRKLRWLLSSCVFVLLRYRKVISSNLVAPDSSGSWQATYRRSPSPAFWKRRRFSSWNPVHSCQGRIAASCT